MVGSSRRRTSGEYPAAAPITVAAATPMPKPAATRPSVTSVWRCNSPVRARSTKVAKITDGGGASRPEAQPIRTMNSHATASTTGSARPSAGRAKRDQRRGFARFAGATSLGVPSLGVPWAAMVMVTGDMLPAAKSMWWPAAPRLSADVAVVHQIVERLLHVDIGRDHAGLLQGEAGLQNGVALLGADAVEGQLGALLELDVDDGAGQFCHVHEDALFVVVVGQAIFARLFVDREHAFGQVGIVFQELLARIEDAPGVGRFVAIEQPRAVFDLRRRHHRIEAGPGVDVAADERDLAVGML